MEVEVLETTLIRDGAKGYGKVPKPFEELFARCPRLSVKIQENSQIKW